MAILFCLFASVAQSQVVLTLDYKEKNSLTTIEAGDKYCLQLDYSISSTTGNASGVKAVINLPDNIYGVSDFVGTTHAPVANFVFTNTVGAKKLTITFVDPLPSGSTGVLEFCVRTNNLTTPNNTNLCTTAEVTDGSGATSGVKNQCINVTAIPRICATKTLLNGGAINNITTYRVRVSATSGGSYPVLAPFGTLQATNITITDSLPANAEFISAKVYNLNNTEIGTGTYSAGVVTASIPNLSLRQLNGTGAWESFYYYLDIQVKFNSPDFNATDVVTNTATVAYTPFSGSASVLNDGDNVGGCVSDLTETTTLAEPTISAVLTKSGGGTYYPGQRFAYPWSFTNNGNTPLDSVEIIETIPANVIIDQDAEFNGVRVAEWDDVDHIEYQTNVSGSTWIVLPDATGVPDLAAGTYFTKIKFVLRSPFPPNASLLANNQILHFKSIGEVTIPETVTNCMEWTSTTAGIPNQAGRTVCNNSVILQPRPTTSKANYTANHLSNCSQVLGGTVTFSGTVTADIGYADGSNPVCALLIPTGSTYVSGSETFTANNSGITTPPTLEIIPNYITTGGVLRDLYRWTFPSGTILPYGKQFTVNVSVKISPALPPGPYNAEFIATFSNASASVPDYNYGNFTDTQDWDLDGNTTELVGRSSTNYGQCDINIAVSASMESIKWVKGICDTTYSRYPAFGQTVPGGNADYKLIVKNTGNVTMKDIKIIDILPFIGDKGVIDPSNRLTAWRPNLADPISAPAGITVYYSTTGNPCRDEVKQPLDPSPFPTGCVPANWSTTPPSDITKVQSVKIDFGTTVLAGGDSLVFNWPMRAPVNAPTNNEIAWNSFGFVATRTDNNQALLAAEPIKVGIKVKPGSPAFYGDLVWFDTNKDGIQDANEGGVDGIKVKLFSPRVTGAQNPATDSLINFTITGNGGYYKFTNLLPGDYYAVFCLPVGYSTSPKNAANSTPNNDSDGSNTTYNSEPATITATTTLTAEEEDYSWDQGIYCDFVPAVTSIQSVTEGSSITLTASGGTTYLWSGPNGFSATTASITINAVTPADTGTYTVNIEVGACRASLITGIQLISCVKPVVSVTPKVQTICVGSAASAYTVTPSTGVEYKWYGPLADTTSSLGTAISGQTTANYTPTGAALAAAGTKYYAVVVNTAGDVTCADTAFVSITVIPSPTPRVDTIQCAGVPPTSGFAYLLNTTLSGGNWSALPTNPTVITIGTPTSTPRQVVGGLTVGTYRFVYTTSTCSDTVTAVVHESASTICTIDSLKTLQRLSDAGNSTLDDVNIVGGERDMQLELLPSPLPEVISGYVGNGIISHSNGPGNYSKLTLTWDGNDNDALTLNPTGLGGINMTGGGEFGFLIAGADILRSKFTLRVYTDAANYSESVVVVDSGTVTQFANIPVKFTTFTAVGSGVDLSNVGAIQLIIEPIDLQTSANGIDLTLTCLQTPCIVPCTKPIASVTPKTQAICVGSSPTAYVVSSSTGVAYTWYGPLADTTSSLGTAISGQTTASYTPTGAALTTAGTKYYAVVVNTIGDVSCADTAFVMLNINAQPVIGDGAATICVGETVDLTAYITNYATFLSPVWKVGTANGTVVATPTSVQPITTTTYVLVAQNAAGCQDTSQVVVTVNAKPNAGRDTTLACVDALSNTLATSYTLVPIPPGGTWSQIGTTPTTAIITGNNVTGMTFAGTYSFVYDLNGCKDTVSVTVSPCAGCVKPDAGPDAVAVCQPISTAKLTALTSGGSWSPIGSPANPSAAMIDNSGNITGLSTAGTYRFVYSVTSGGQTCTDTAEVIVNAKPSIGDGAVTICSGETVDLTAQITNYATFLSPVWTVGTANGTVVATPTSVQPITTTTYVLVAQNAEGCKDTSQVVVTVNPKPNAGRDTTLACVDALSNTLATSYTLVPIPTGGTWSQIGTTPTTAIITGNNVTGMTFAGTYSFVYDLNGCKDTVSVTVSP
ncbi:SdrD B-like domain-containing protein, partial [Runella aurantiaca]|uniref:SdrD B-like domain-containing protein n=1 Tax=Runella aurantiaca TaxID=2282308 RepID=UPI00286DCD64